MSKTEKVQMIIGMEVDKYTAKYGTEYSNIIKGEIGENELILLDTLKGCSYERDSRTSLTYAQDLIINWVLEDYILDHSEKLLGLQLFKNGADKDRQFLKHNKIKGTADFYYMENEEKVLVEMMTNYSDFWSRAGLLHLRDKKYEKMIKAGVLLLAVNLHDNTLGFVTLGEARSIEHHGAYGGKPAMEIKIPKGFTKSLIV